jgi:hypothetical protein
MAAATWAPPTSPRRAGSSSRTSQGVTFNSFSGSVDFTDVENISLWIEGVFGGTDIQIDFIESTVVPEPSLLALLGIAGLAIAGRKRA